jgi:molybdopterin-binding protein
MEISARNQFKGMVKSIITGGVMAEIGLDIGNGNEVVSVIRMIGIRPRFMAAPF